METPREVHRPGPLTLLGVLAAGLGVVALVAALTLSEGEGRELVLAASLSATITLLVSLVLVRRILRPLSRLERFAAAIAAGELDRRPHVREGGALGRLARALERMADELARRLAEVTSEKEQLQAVLAGMVEGVLVLDATGRVSLANPRLREMFRVWGPVAGRTPLEVIRHPDVDEALRLARVKPEAVTRELQIGGTEGRALLLHAARFPAAGPPIGVVAVFHDVSELRRLENLRRDFVANVSHELRTPLTAIRGFAETLVGAELPPEEVKRCLEIIQRHADRLSALIEDLLELSRIESRKTPLRPAPLDVARVAAGVVSGIEPQVRARSLRIDLVPSHAPLALADRRAVEQVLTNLVDNAVKYTNAGGSIRVSVSASGGRVRVDVQDDGIGIPAEDLPRIFERFYRVDKARSRDLGGTGLGLAIVKHLVQAMDGEIGVSSEAGRGSTFWITLPAADVPAVSSQN